MTTATNAMTRIALRTLAHAVRQHAQVVEDAKNGIAKHGLFASAARLTEAVESEAFLRALAPTRHAPILCAADVEWLAREETGGVAGLAEDLRRQVEDYDPLTGYNDPMIKGMEMYRQRGRKAALAALTQLLTALAAGN